MFLSLWCALLIFLPTDVQKLDLYKWQLSDKLPSSVKWHNVTSQLCASPRYPQAQSRIIISRIPRFLGVSSDAKSHLALFLCRTLNSTTSFSFHEELASVVPMIFARVDCRQIGNSWRDTLTMCFRWLDLIRICCCRWSCWSMRSIVLFGQSYCWSRICTHWHEDSYNKRRREM